MPQNRTLLNALSLDVEEWFQVHNLAGAVARGDWEKLPSRVVESTRSFLDLIEARDARATFFVLGWVAERAPRLVEEIARRGHEVASHGYGHRLLTETEPAAFEADLERTERILTEITGARPIGYRAPSFTVTARSLWALDILHRRGYRYDSSVFPIRRRRYGIPAAPRRPHVARRTGDRLLWSFPMLTRRVFGRNLPLAGGGYLRLFPAAWIGGAVRAMNRAGWPAMVYLHPWELDPGQPCPAGLELRRRFLHRVNLKRTRGKLERLLASFRFTTVHEALDACLAAHPGLEDEPVSAALGEGGSGTR
jgi:polysaccharide deacetylase family protein (PEP-CTERM system associated)